MQRRKIYADVQMPIKKRIKILNRPIKTLVLCRFYGNNAHTYHEYHYNLYDKERFHCFPHNSKTDCKKKLSYTFLNHTQYSILMTSSFTFVGFGVTNSPLQGNPITDRRNSQKQNISNLSYKIDHNLVMMP